MTLLKRPESRTVLISLLIAACIFTLVSACSSKKPEGETETDSTAATIGSTTPDAETDPAPPAGETAASTPPIDNGEAGSTVATTTDKDPNVGSKPMAHKPTRHAAKNLDGATSTGVAIAPQQTSRAQATPETQVEPTQPEQTRAARQPASPDTTSALPATAPAESGDLPSEPHLGGLIEKLLAYRTALMAAIGVVLATVGAFAVWKKRQTAT